MLSIVAYVKGASVVSNEAMRLFLISRNTVSSLRKIIIKWDNWAKRPEKTKIITANNLSQRFKNYKREIKIFLLRVL